LKAEFSSILRLFESLEGEVRGRSNGEPPPEIQTLLSSLLDESLSSAEERRRAFELLRSEPDWLAWFALRIKDRRQLSSEAAD
jgi:hypothetical protein